MIAFLRRNEVWAVLAGIVLVNTAFVAAIAAELLPRGAYNYGRFLLLGGVLVLVVGLSRGAGGLWSLIRPMTVWRVHPGWYVLALCWAAGIATLTLTGLALSGAGSGVAASDLNLALVLRPDVAATILIGSFVGEIVWVSYAVGQLSKRMSPFVASQIVGAVWTAWWMPMVVLNVGIIPDLPVLPLLINMMGIAAMCAFVYFNTRSGLVVLMLQVMVNSSIVIFPIAPTSGGVEAYTAFALVYYGAVMLLFLTWGRGLFSRAHGAAQRA